MSEEITSAVMPIELDQQLEVPFSSTPPIDFTIRLNEENATPSLLDPMAPYPDGQLLDCRIRAKETDLSVPKDFTNQSSAWLDANPSKNCENNSNSAWLDNHTRENQEWLGSKTDYVTETVQNDTRTTWITDDDKTSYVSEHREAWLHSEKSVYVKNSESWLPSAALESEDPKRYNLIRVSSGLLDAGHLIEPGRKNKRRLKSVECFKCQFCPMMTLNREMMGLHSQRKGACMTDAVMTRCPGCDNVFYNQSSLKFHLSRDHNMLVKDVRMVMVHLPRVTVTNFISEKPSCLYEGSNQIQITTSYNSQEPAENNDMPSCANAKREISLEAYLRGIPSRLPQTTHDILENTFNFTAPVSEQLPSIQPENPPAASGLDKEHLIEESNMELKHRSHVVDQIEDEVTVISSIDPIDQKIAVATDDRKMSEIDEVMDCTVVVDGAVEEIASKPVYHIADFHQEAYHEEVVEFNYQDAPVETECIVAEIGGNEVARQTLYCAEETQPEIKKKCERKIDCGFLCNINNCKIRMQSEENIKYHRRCHEGQLYSCPECCKDSTYWEGLSSHLWLKHKIDMELYKCDMCPYRTTSYSRLTNMHRGIHGTEKPFLCDICGNSYKTRKQMRNHKVVHGPKKMDMYECEFCGRWFKTKSAINKHVQIIHQNKLTFVCSVCGFKTGTKHSLILHNRTHTGEKPYKCDKCTYKGKDHNAFRRHQLRHGDGYQYKCPHCSYKCIQATSFKYHTRNKHPKEQEPTIYNCGQCMFETISRDKFLHHNLKHTGSSYFEPSSSFYQDQTNDQTL